MPLCLSCGRSEPHGVRVCTRCNGTEFSNFRSSAVGLPKKPDFPAEPTDAELLFDISAVEQFLAEAPEASKGPSAQSLREVKRQARKRRLRKLLRRKQC
jgi:hypothetical protein